MTEATPQHINNTFGEVEVGRVAVKEVFSFQVLCDKKHGHVSNYLGRGSDFDDIAKELVYVSISMGYFLPTVTESHAVGLFLEIGVLPAGHVVEVNLSGAASGSGIERFGVG